MATLYENFTFVEDEVTLPASQLIGTGFDWWAAQTFTPAITHTISSVILSLYKRAAGSPEIMTVSIRATDTSGHPAGDDLCSGTTNGNTLPDPPTPEEREITFLTNPILTAGIQYAIVVRVAGGAANDAFWYYEITGADYADGARETSINGGSSWSTQTQDHWFKEYGDPYVFTPPSDVITYKKLLTAGNNKIYYGGTGATAKTMTELVTTGSVVDTSDQLNMFEAYQKAFIVNGANLKVADFVNTKLTVAAMTKPPAHGDILSQDQTAGNVANMVVDFVNTAMTAIYGYAYYDGAATTFLTTIDITSNNAIATMDPSPIPLASVTAVTAGPHWYNWTVYPDVVLTEGATPKSYGTMPNKAYIGCLYRGRSIISGNPEHPHLWYMPRQANPWDFAYLAGDAGTPVKGGNADAGELGDIIRCLIPYKDDYLIFGCATCIWYLSGDPAYGGDLGGLDLTTGIFGANSWCWDGAGTLYFWGTNGFYKTTIPGTPICLSAIALPDLVKDEAADPSTHRITMAYDRRDYGIHICIIKLSDGSNSNYWYDLKTEGFFPEVYPDQCGPYSLFFYAANNTAYRDLLVGCKDGYIRKFDKTAEDDNIGGSDQLIDSYTVLGPIQLSDGINDGTLGNINIISAGGISGGGDDSNDIEYSVFAARTSEHITKDVTTATAKYSGVFSSPGYQKGNKDRRKARGRFGAVKIGNDTATETWGFEKLTLDVKQIGRVL